MSTNLNLPKPARRKKSLIASTSLVPLTRRQNDDIGAQNIDEDGWRKYSPTHINQTFGKIGWQNESSKLDLSYIGAYNNMIGNGLTPIDMLGSDRTGIHTTPDQTKNY